MWRWLKVLIPSKASIYHTYTTWLIFPSGSKYAYSHIIIIGESTG